MDKKKVADTRAMMEIGVDRRDFLKGAALLGAGMVGAGALTACAPSDGVGADTEAPPSGGASTPPTATSGGAWRTPPAKIADSEIKQTYDTEIGIIGLGHAGLAVYRAAAEKGAKTLAIEEQPRDTWWTVGHDIGHINSKFLKGRGVPEVDPVEFYNTFMVQAQAKPNPHIVMEFAQNSGDAIDWYLDAVDQSIVDAAHVSFWPDNKYTVKTLSNGYRYYTGTAQWWEDSWKHLGMIINGEGLEIKELSHENLSYVEDKYSNATALFETKGVQLVQDNNGHVSGFVAESPDGYIKVNASKGVVLAGGGFGGNPEMCQDLIPHIVNMCTSDENIGAMMDRDGSSIQMGVWAGGRVEGEPSSMNFDSARGPDSFSSLWIDESCKRFQDEAFAGPEVNCLFLARGKRGIITAVYDSNYELNLLTGFPGHGSFDYSDEYVVETQKAQFEAAKEAGSEGAEGFYCADTLDQLADYLGYDADHKAQFLATIENYNKLCAAGKDTEYGKDPRFLFPIKEAPFYAHVGNPLSIGFGLVTTGGLVTTNDYQVVDSSYQPISGLYATGNSCGMRFGPAYITPIPGLSIGFCITLGRVLGENLATI
jgi:hypothetical protein